MRRARKTARARGEPISIDVGALRRRFRALRAARGLSQADVAALLDVSQATISSFEHGRHALVRPATLLALQAFVRASERDDPAVSVRTVVRRGAPVACVWCARPLPRMEGPVRFCPTCGGHQFPVCACGAAAFDARAKYCSACGQPIGPAQGRVSGQD